MHRHTIMIVEDHAAVREGLKSILKQSGDFVIVAETGSTEKVPLLAEHHKPDILLLDIALGSVSGMDLIESIRSRHAGCRIVIHSMFARLDYLQQALSQGAAGYITKQSSPEILTAGLKIIARGEYFFDHFISELMLPELIKHTINIIEERFQDYESLSNREQEVFKLLAEGFSNRAVGSKLFISHRTVENYKSAILRKLSLNNDAELVRYAQKIGLI
ncbi:response regulator transcription factor [Marispirochaeta aestuarii]|uniref:response regulator transcription factor n=1 Tax=Marispirochaeta aestuarii TaxID=1963862 RepID=UPI0029C77C54|nr:response regulator transcription factor [Marispirochaeta aestuarii]